MLITGTSNCRKPSYYSAELKQRLAAAANQPGFSLSTIAQEQGGSPSALSKRRLQYQQPEPATLLPIAVEADRPVPASQLESHVSLHSLQQG
ncbi:transposase [unidentified bacterial endosymbiont]|uniref:transposase n=1 Tax=unidentified bacterial endosymbiont TaxID=2355 RepID=UPI0026467C32|nr:transposase [unidentified bacterial endosymbiont]